MLYKKQIKLDLLNILFTIYKFNYADEQIILLNNQVQDESNIEKRNQLLNQINQIMKNLRDKKVEL